MFNKNTITATTAARIEELDRVFARLERRSKLAAQINDLDARLVSARDAADIAGRNFDAWMIERSRGGGGESIEAIKADMCTAASTHFSMKQRHVEEHHLLLETRCEAKRNIAATCDCFCQNNEEYCCYIIPATEAMLDAYGKCTFYGGDQKMMYTYCRFCERVDADAPPLFALGITLYEHNHE